MAFKFKFSKAVLLASLLTIQNCATLGPSRTAFSHTYKRAPLPKASPAYEKITKAILPEPKTDANYSYTYAVDDPQSGDSKSLQEVRQGDVVYGRYSLIDPDGTRRVVEYTADPKNGFNAVVRKLPLLGVNDITQNQYYL